MARQHNNTFVTSHHSTHIFLVTTPSALSFDLTPRNSSCRATYRGSISPEWPVRGSGTANTSTDVLVASFRTNTLSPQSPQSPWPSLRRGPIMTRLKLTEKTTHTTRAIMAARHQQVTPAKPPNPHPLPQTAREHQQLHRSLHPPLPSLRQNHPERDLPKDPH